MLQRPDEGHVGRADRACIDLKHHEEAARRILQDTPDCGLEPAGVEVDPMLAELDREQSNDVAQMVRRGDAGAHEEFVRFKHGSIR